MEKMEKEPPMGKVMNVISNNNYRVVKYMDGSSNVNIKCRKIILLKISNKKKLIQLIENHLQQVRDYLMRRNKDIRGRQLSHRWQDEFIFTKRDVSQQQVEFIITTRYQQLSTLQDFYIGDRHKMLRNQLIVSEETNRAFNQYFIIEMFQLVIRAGGIDNFFYTPKTVFFLPPSIQRKDSELNSQPQYGKLLVNYTSLTALKLFFTKEEISKRDLEEIYACLPCDYDDNVVNNNKKSLARLNVEIKMRGFGWLMLTFVIRFVPRLMFYDSSQPIAREEMIKLIRESPDVFQDLLKISQFKKRIQEVQKVTKLNLFQLFTRIFIDNCKGLEWQMIYNWLLPPPPLTKLLFHQWVLTKMWRQQQDKKFYMDRALKSHNNLVYFLVKMNLNFHKMLKNQNFAITMINQQFSQDYLEIYVKLMNSIPKSDQPDELADLPATYASIPEPLSQLGQRTKDKREGSHETNDGRQGRKQKEDKMNGAEQMYIKEGRDMFRGLVCEELVPKFVKQANKHGEIKDHNIPQLFKSITFQGVCSENILSPLFDLRRQFW